MDREAMFRKMVADFPDSALGHFSLGAFLLETKRYGPAIASLVEATRLQPDYAAAWVALGDAAAAAGDAPRARGALAQARTLAVAQGHGSLAEDIDRRVAELGQA